MAKEKRNCLYAITIHLDDEIRAKNEYVPIDIDNLNYQLQAIFNPTTEAYYILHDKDTNEDGTLKTPHIHLVLQFKYNCGKTFNAMKGLLPKSHIEECFNFANAVLYLTHETPEARKENKYIYDREAVVNVFNSDISKHYNAFNIEPFDWNKIEDYIIKDGERTILDFGRRFGYNVIHNKMATIKEVIEYLIREGTIDK